MLQHDADSGAVADAGRSALPAADAGRLADTPAQDRSGRWTRRLGPEDRAALGFWIAAHVVLLVLAWAADWAFRSQAAHAPLTSAFEHWDANLLQNIAQYGYFGVHSTAHTIAFFPGFPAVLSLTHLLLRNWVLSGLAVSGIAGCFAVVALARLANSRRAVLYLLATPAAVFLMVGYAESLFLAFAIPAWLAATRGQWWRAALLAALAGFVRPDGLFLTAALVIMALTGQYRSAGLATNKSGATGAPLRRKRLTNAAIAFAGLAGPAAYEGYLRAKTGSWLAWSHAEQAGWDLHLTSPAQALRTTWWAAFRHPFSASIAFEFQLELAAMAVMILAALAFAGWRRWPEAVYCGLAVVALGTSTWFQTCPRTLMLLFPIWVALARIAARRPWVGYAYLTVSAPLAIVLGMLYLSGQWAG